ncbi:hypothetical protein LFT48_18600 [Arthrobacter sp. FW305-123]|nr:hypothetical protein LFT48_18600 [Arthrobacter sp. FW305-123]
MTTAATFQGNKPDHVKEQRVARFAGVIIGVFTLLWAFLLLADVGGHILAAGPLQVATHGLSVVSALIVFFYCRALNYRTSAAGLLCFVAVAFYFADVALGFNYSPYFGVAVLAWGASARRPFLAGAGVLVLGAAIVARYEHSLAGVAVAGVGLIILVMALAIRPKNQPDWH